ncbi:alkaline phosphatase [Paludisphaera rhizosphaerae]|uniref:alkaline phosphatase n=1 Tax=Paludisphaera rhizosphaerae TaxID=2711216 RepID=UPI0013E9A22A|nr:alkaline phosphatase [Paludisphaera rhizosphaerae]
MSAALYRVLPLVLIASAALARGDDRLRELQERAVATRDQRLPRPYHFGSQAPNDVFTNHGSHTNRLIPVYTFGSKADLGAVTGENSRYRTEEGVRSLFGVLPPNTVNPDAVYADQSDLYRVQKNAAARGAKYIFTVWFDGLDWDTTRAAAIVKAGRVGYSEGKGTGLVFQDYDAAGTARFGFVVTAPTHDKTVVDVDRQTVALAPGTLGGGYDPMIAGPTPWTPGPLFAQARGYLKGQSASETDRDGVAKVGRVLHAYTDSAPSAGEFSTGVKSYNTSINVAEDGRFAPTLFNELQAKGWAVGIASSVVFDDASPAATYAHNVSRGDCQDLGREMLGLPSIVQETGKGPRLPGLDVVIGCGEGHAINHRDVSHHGLNAAKGGYLSDDDLAAIDARRGGPYVVVRSTPGVEGPSALRSAADRAAGEGKRLFGLFGSSTQGHLPFRTADGDFRPVAGASGKAESYSAEDLRMNPTLSGMTEAALAVLAARKTPFALFVEAGDVDWALHDNNLDNAVGAVFSGEEAVRTIIAWVEAHSNWDESVLIVTADHGHYLVLDDPEALVAGPPKP